MTDNDRDQLHHAISEGREWLATAADDVGERLNRAWKVVRDRAGDARESTSADSTSQPVDGANLDDADLFESERRRELEELARAHILIVGQTGVGKSTLINAIFRKPLAEAGTGRPVTRIIQRFEAPDVPVVLYDTKGVELGDSKQRVIRDF